MPRAVRGKAGPDRIRWSEAAEKAFGTLRRALCWEPVLITPDFALALIVHTDASEVGLGGVLSQIWVGEEHPITYISRKLLPNERNYSKVEKEALAIKGSLGPPAGAAAPATRPWISG